MLQITNTSRARLIYLIALTRLYSELGNKKHNGHGVTSDRWCHVSSDQGAGERRGGVIMIDISAGDTSAIWHVRWRGITRKIRQGRAGQQIRKNIQLVWKKPSPNTWLVIELVTKWSAYSGANEPCSGAMNASSLRTGLSLVPRSCVPDDLSETDLLSQSMTRLGQSHRQKQQVFYVNGFHHKERTLQRHNNTEGWQLSPSDMLPLCWSMFCGMFQGRSCL